MALRELLVAFGIEVQGAEKIKKVESSLDGVIKKVSQAATVLGAAVLGRAVVGFITDQIEVGRNLQQTSEKLGVSVEDLEKYRYAAGMAGMSTEEADRALMLFNRSLGTAEDGNKSMNKELAKLAPGMSAAQIEALGLQDKLGLVSDKFKTLKTSGEKTQLMMRLFGRGGAALIPLFEDGRIKKYAKEFDALGGGIGSDFAQKATEAAQALKRVNFQWEVFKTRIVAAVLPGVEKIIHLFSTVIVELDHMRQKTLFAQTSLIALASAAVIAFAPFLASMLPIVAGLGAMYLLFDDLYTLFRGGDTLIGRFIDKLFGVGTAKKVVQEVKEDFKAFVDWMKDEGIPKVQAFGNWLKESFEKSIPVIREIIKDVGRAVDLLSGSWMAAAHGIAAGAYAVTGNSAAADREAMMAGQAVDRAGNAVFGNKSGISIIPSDAWAHGPAMLPGNSFAYPPGTAPAQKKFSVADEAMSQAPVQIEQKNTVHVMIQGVNDPEEVKQAAQQGISQGFEENIRHALDAIPKAGK